MLFGLLSEIDEGWKGSESDEWHLVFEAVELPAFAGNGQLPVAAVYAAVAVIDYGLLEVLEGEQCSLGCRVGSRGGWDQAGLKDSLFGLLVALEYSDSLLAFCGLDEDASESVKPELNLFGGS
jgi:hypothetical protein